jgi:hypothetical protein
MRWTWIRLAFSLVLSLAVGASIALTAPAPAPKDDKRAAGQDGLVLRIEAMKTEIESAKDLRIKATLSNQGKEAVTLVLPGDGSDCAWRTPVVGWSVLTDPKAEHPEYPPLNKSPRCGNVNALNSKEVFTLDPKESKQLEGWYSRPELSEPGTYRIVFYYFNEPGRKWRGVPLGEHDENTMKKVQERSPCALRSNELVIKVTGVK